MIRSNAIHAVLFVGCIAFSAAAIISMPLPNLASTETNTPLGSATLLPVHAGDSRCRRSITESAEPSPAASPAAALGESDSLWSSPPDDSLTASPMPTETPTPEAPDGTSTPSPTWTETPSPDAPDVTSSASPTLAESTGLAESAVSSSSDTRCARPVRADAAIATQDTIEHGQGESPSPGHSSGTAATLAVNDATEIPVDVTWNGESHGRALLMLKDANLYIRTSDLDPYNLHIEQGRTILAHGTTFLPLQSLAGQIDYKFSSKDLVLSVTTNASLLPHHDVAFGYGGKPKFSNDPVRAFLLNYTVSTTPGRPLTGLLEQRVNIAHDVVFENQVGRNFDGSIGRGITALTVDSPARLRRTTVGDMIIAGDDLAGSASVFGVSVSRTFSLNPYATIFPLPSLDTAVTSPTEALVYSNGLLVRTVELQPGRYNLADIPMQAGYGRTQVVLRDQFGARLAFDQSGSAPTSLLRRGLSDYQYGFGLSRSSTPGFWRYGEAALSGRYRIGLSDAFTGGATIQSKGATFNADLNFDAAPGVGQIHGAVAFSSWYGLRGTGALLEYGASRPGSSASVIVRAQSGTYRAMSESLRADPSTLDVALSLSQRVGLNSAVTVTDRVSHHLFDGIVHHFSVTTSRPVGRWLLSMSAFGDSARGYRTQGIQFTLGRPLGRHGYEAVTQTAGANAAQTISITHSGASPLDTSYQISAQGARQIIANAQVGLPYATIGANVSSLTAVPRKTGSLGAAFDLAGSIVFAKGGPFFAQSVRDGFALIETAGIAHVPIYVNNLYAGRTNAAGRLLAPFLSSNQRNDVDASSDGMPLAEIVDSTQRAVGPSYHAGTRVRFEAHRIHALSGHVSVRYRRELTVPAFGEATLVGAHRYTSGIDDTGRVYFDATEPGAYLLTISDSDGAQCLTSITVRAFEAAIHDFGAIVCERSS